MSMDARIWQGLVVIIMLGIMAAMLRLSMTRVEVINVCIPMGRMWRKTLLIIVRGRLTCSNRLR